MNNKISEDIEIINNIGGLEIAEEGKNKLIKEVKKCINGRGLTDKKEYEGNLYISGIRVQGGEKILYGTITKQDNKYTLLLQMIAETIAYQKRENLLEGREKKTDESESVPLIDVLLRNNISVRGQVLDVNQKELISQIIEEIFDMEWEKEDARIEMLLDLSLIIGKLKE